MIPKHKLASQVTSCVMYNNSHKRQNNDIKFTKNNISI